MQENVHIKDKQRKKLKELINELTQVQQDNTLNSLYCAEVSHKIKSHRTCKYPSLTDRM